MVGGRWWQVENKKKKKSRWNKVLSILDKKECFFCSGCFFLSWPSCKRIAFVCLFVCLFFFAKILPPVGTGVWQ